ncbi:MAG: patatin-like phospholipase family protein [Saprospiraceae bacterium]|nr:patatin-like phospholipase family protein [Saprospiraceae bacterium]
MRKLGIALSGGGTRGMVHVGALQALAEHDIHPDVIAGTSAGSVVGALYAYGYEPHEIKGFAHHRNLIRIFAFKIPNKGFVRHSFLQKQLRRYLPQNDFHVLKKPFYVTVANLNSGKPESWSEGPLIDLIVASCSIPILFEPVEIGGQLYVDGGLLQNLPAESIRPHCDVLVGINLVPRLELSHDDMKSVIGIGSRCFDLAALNNIKPQLQFCDLVIEPDAIQDYSRFNFRQIDKMYEIGYEETLEHIDGIKELLAGVSETAQS